MVNCSIIDFKGRKIKQKEMYVIRKGLERSRKVREAKIKVLSRELYEINEALKKLIGKGKKK